MDYELADEELCGNEELANGPTFEDLAIDDSLSDLERVTKYVCSNIALQRVIHVKMLQETARSVGFQAACDQLIPLLEPLACDVEYVVRQHVALQFPPLCRFLVDADAETGYRVLLDKMIPLVAKLLSDEQHEVRTAASESLVELAALVKPEDQGPHVLTLVLPLAHDDDNEQFRISAVSLYNGLAAHFGRELCQQFCVPELISLSEDPVFRVRKSTASSFPNVCKTAGPELSRERLLPAFERLAKDDIWGVRKACAETLVSIALALAPADRGPLLVPLFERFVQDSSRWVRMAAYQSLGPFLAALDAAHLTDHLVAHFVSMATTASMQLGGSGEVDIKFHCAFNFPAVVSLLGAAQWPQLSPTFEKLHNDSFWKIRRSFAYSLHELARMLGQGITETQLATAFDGYLHDVQDVRLGAMLHFADFLEHVSPSFRESYLPVLAEFDSFDQSTKWRFREVLSRQLAQLCRTFTPDATFSVIYPLVFKLITDPVAVVRQQSYHACPLLVARLGANAQWLDVVIARFVGLATSVHFQERQCYLKICASFLASADEGATAAGGQTTDEQATELSALARGERDRAFFSAHLAAVFFTLALDPVSNVRVVFAETVATHQTFFQRAADVPEPLRELLAARTSQSAEQLADALTARVQAQAKPTRTSEATPRLDDVETPAPEAACAPTPAVAASSASVVASPPPSPVASGPAALALEPLAPCASDPSSPLHVPASSSSSPTLQAPAPAAPEASDASTSPCDADVAVDPVA